MLSLLSSGLQPSAKRRVHQSVLLASKVADKQRQIDRQSAQLVADKNRIDDLTAQLAAAQKQLERVKQPYNYLIDQLQARENEIRQCHTTIRQLNVQIEALSNDYQRSVDTQRRLQEDVQRLLKHNKEALSLQAVMASASQARGAGAASPFVPSPAVRPVPTGAQQPIASTPLAAARGQPSDLNAASARSWRNRLPVPTN